ncbi:MAG: hypothetical protein ACYC6Y_24325 [Thermoguttaceae bacterium]
MNDTLVNSKWLREGQRKTLPFTNAERYAMSNFNRRSCNTEQKAVGIRWRVGLIASGVILGGFYGLCVVAYYHLNEPVFGGAYEGIRFGIPAGTIIGALFGFVSGSILDHRAACYQGQFFLKDILVMGFVLAILLWLTKSYVIPVFTYG